MILGNALEAALYLKAPNVYKKKIKISHDHERVESFPDPFRVAGMSGLGFLQNMQSFQE